MILARNNYTPVDFWAGLHLVDFAGWVRANNSLQEKLERKNRQ